MTGSPYPKADLYRRPLLADLRRSRPRVETREHVAPNGRGAEQMPGALAQDPAIPISASRLEE
jgi:hypothetical protein